MAKNYGKLHFQKRLNQLFDLDSVTYKVTEEKKHLRKRNVIVLKNVNV